MVFNATFNNITGISWRDLFLKTVAPVIIIHIKSSNTYQKASEILVESYFLMFQAWPILMYLVSYKGLKLSK
jgi:hypothetical protein